LVVVAKTTSIPRHDLSLSKTWLASISLLSTTVVLERQWAQLHPVFGEKFRKSAFDVALLSGESGHCMSECKGAPFRVLVKFCLEEFE
jgi:hypothetical protein